MATGFIDGQEVLGQILEQPPTVILELNGVVDSNEGDKFSGIGLVAGGAGINYNFGERIDGGSTPSSGVTGGIAFWQNKKGQTLIKSLNGGENSTLLARWLSGTFSNMYGMLADANGDGAVGDYYTNSDIATLYQQLFKRNGKTTPGGPPKLDVQVMGIALASYVTRQSLVSVNYVDLTTNASLVTGVEAYGFYVTIGGVGTTYFNVLDVLTAQQAADLGLDPDDNGNVMVLDLLVTTNSLSDDGLLYDTNGDGQILDFEAMLRTLANEVYSFINEYGRI